MDFEQIKKDMKHAVRLAESAEERGDDFVVVDVNLLYRLAVHINMLIEKVQK